MPYLCLFWLYRRIIYAHIYVLIVIAEILAEDGKAADMLRIAGNFKPEADIAPVVDIKILKRNGRDLKPVYKRSFAVDNDKLQQAVLVPVLEPPVRSKIPLHIPEIPGACPHSEARIVQVKVDRKASCC